VEDILGRKLPAKVELRGRDGDLTNAAGAPSGTAILTQPVGDWDAYIYVYDNGVPILSEVQKVAVVKGKTSLVSVKILEGSGGQRRLSAFDQDHDGALDRVELAMGTRPDSAASVPGMKTLDWDSSVLKGGGQWYVGEMHAHSNYGIGSESVAELVRRAERSGLDFMCITDRNSLEAAMDPDHQSDRVVLVPAMEWGSDEKGVALIYGPRTFPGVAETYEEAQALSYRVQAQGGAFVVAHPLFGTAPWQWGVRHVNAIEVWCRDWRAVPPLFPEMLNDTMRARAPKSANGRPGKPLYSIARAASTPEFSANGQAALFWDMETVRGLRASVIAGSYSVGPHVKLAAPATYVYANEKSVNGILEGIRLGRTFVSSSVDGPQVYFWADLKDETWENGGDLTVDMGMGGFIPLHTPTRFVVEVFGANGKRLEVLRNGRPIRSFLIEGTGSFSLYSFIETPDTFAVYRVRIVEPGTEKENTWGRLEMLAMTSPIYAYDIITVDETSDSEAWVVNIESDVLSPEDLQDYLPNFSTQWEQAPVWEL
jgi:hypothetical protein